MPEDAPSLVMLGASHRTAPLAVREKLAVTPDLGGPVYERLKSLSIRECAVLSTCNRVEIYAVGVQDQLRRELEGCFCDFHGFDHETFRQFSQFCEGKDAVQHLFEVASGVDSLVVGETEILGQVKSAYSLAQEERALGPVLNRVFQKSFQAAKWVRTHTALGEGRVSVATVAVDLAKKIFGDLRDCHILVIGAGEIAEKTLLSLQGNGAKRLTVSNRTSGKAMELASSYGGSALPFEQFAGALHRFDIVIASTGSDRPILRVDELAGIIHQRPVRPLFLIDLAVPRNIDSGAADLDNVFLYNVDDLSEIAESNLAARESEVQLCRRVLGDRAAHLWEHLHRRLAAYSG